MCGIAGAVGPSGETSIDAGLMRRMLGRLRHRGPDQFGVYVAEHGRRRIGLGSARLSIIDLGGGQQPIGNEDGTMWIVLNGEIFNYLELREQLVALGHRFITDSDTEVILHLYEQYGPACLERLNGQFAVAIWDERREELFLARDRVGIRPLFYAQRGELLVFGSEIKSLLAHPALDATIDPVALEQIFTYWSPLAPRTAFRGISSLPPGHWMKIGRDGAMRINRYWQWTFPSAADRPAGSLDEATEQLRSHLADATRIRLRADVPVGAYLSGGLDSATVTALVPRCGDNHLETFSVAFTDENYDESPYQQQLAARLGSRHHVIRCDQADIGRVFPEVIRHTETPILRTAPAPLYLLSRLVHEHGFKVVLTGEGADEILAGYQIFKEAKVRRFWARQPESAWRPSLLRRLYGYVSDLAGNSDAFLRRFFGRGLDGAGGDTFSHEVRWTNTRRLNRMFSDELKNRIAADDDAAAGAMAPDTWNQLSLPDDFARFSPLAKAQYLEATIFLPEYLLSSQGDRVAMAHAVEGRFPFLDYRVVEFCNQLPPGWKLRGLCEKHILRRAAQGLVPSEVLNRPKQPYRAPIGAAFFPDGKPLDWVAEELSPAALTQTGYFNPVAVAMLVRKLERFGSLSETDEMALAGVLSTQLLHRTFVSEQLETVDLNEHDDVKTVIRGSLAAGLPDLTTASVFDSPQPCER
jgi:asparagine synthase (glutamine-hydrolysing)